METILKRVCDIIENDEYCPIPLEVIPNNMGINLCSVDAVSWQKQEDGQLVNVSIYFNPSQADTTTEIDGQGNIVSGPGIDGLKRIPGC